MISDLHIGHSNVIEFEDYYRSKAMGVSTIHEHDEKICDLWNDKVHKRDLVFVLGDLGFNIDILKTLPGRKKLHLGNHDKCKAARYLEIFEDIIGPVHYKGHWISHFPIHESEIWGRKVIHGHTHSKGINDSRYVNVSVEMTGGAPIPFEDIKEGKFYTWDKVNFPFGDNSMLADKNPNLSENESIKYAEFNGLDSANIENNIKNK